MLWRKISKTTPLQQRPYKEWKMELSQEALHSCVYCCVHESYFGGIRNYHVEHYKPKSKFAELQNDYSNLFYCCAICNVFKGNDWIDLPADQNSYSAPFYPNPSLTDYAGLLSVDGTSKRVLSAFVTGKYLIERLYLNRPQLIIARRAHEVRKSLQTTSSDLAALSSKLGNGLDSNTAIKVIGLLDRALQIIALMDTAVPYETAETRRV
jgi:uncharacterized protein (TIGR02646 family)